ncbi:MAG: D-glycero-beta-D-manno-heptose-7-phosphate kinase [Bdellovibrionales bacterium]|nr:D-glycero-beta-D-manno-heptose-7-phosphate kinase [Bdellovibrionales bacterium]
MSIKSIDSESLEEYKRSLINDLPLMEGKKFIVLGDVGLDEYVIGEVKRISPEAPVPVVEVERQESRLGLAANVAANIVSLGGICYLVGVVGVDDTNQHFRDLLKENGIKDHLLVEDNDRPTTKKMRIMAQHQQVVRVDYEKRRFLRAAIENQMFENIAGVIDQIDGIILEDYAKGVLSASLCQRVVQLAHQHGVKVLVDPHRSTPIEYYKGVDLIKPNKDEALLLSGLNIDDLREKQDTIIEVGNVIKSKTGSENVIITEGKKGMTLFTPKGTVTFPTYAREVFDVTGAGDTVIAALGLAWSSGLSLEKSCVFANFAAGVVVAHVGCVPCKKSELINYIHSH